jgi:hypothetical protein
MMVFQDPISAVYHHFCTYTVDRWEKTNLAKAAP